LAESRAAKEKARSLRRSSTAKRHGGKRQKKKLARKRGGKDNGKKYRAKKTKKDQRLKRLVHEGQEKIKGRRKGAADKRVLENAMRTRTET